MKKIISLTLSLALLCGAFVGCGQVGNPPVSSANDPEQSASAPQISAPEKNDQRQITDMAGRTMLVPSEITSAFSTGSVSAIYLYMMVPDRLLGWNYQLNDLEKSIILEEYHDLPNFGMNDAINYEAVIAANPDITFHVSAINKGTMDEADQLSEKLGIPVVMVSSDLNDAPDVFRFMGELFNVPEQAEQLAAYTQETFDDITALDLSEEDKVRVYYGNGEDSLNTAPAGSSHAQIMDLVKVHNVAQLELGEGSRVQVSLEQVLAWDPDVILVNGEPKADISGNTAAQAILTDPDWSSITAVKEGKVYGTPNVPFSWVDRPPGPNRIVGLRWLAGLLYPELVDFDVDEEVTEFFQLFYHVELTPERLQKIYQGST